MSDVTCPICEQPLFEIAGHCFGCAVRDRGRFLPERIGAYPILKEIGQGGMGTVYLAKQHCPEREVAVKVIRDGLFAADALRARFLWEREIAGRFEHPNIIRVYDAGEDEDGQLYYVMEHARRGTLCDLTRTSSLSTVASVRLIVEVALAVDYAHGFGILHRDLKPSNILIGDDLRPRVTDFGVAKVLDSDASVESAHEGTLVGSWPYMAPEQAGYVDAGSPAPCAPSASAATDVYGIGAILYELLAGQPPCQARTREQFLQALAAGEPRALRGIRRDVSYELEAVAMKAIERDPGKRYATAAAFVEDLRHALGRRKPSAKPRAWRGRALSFMTRHASWLSIVMGAVLVTAAALLSLNQILVRDGVRRNEHLKAQTLQAARSLREDFKNISVITKQLARDPDARRVLRSGASARDPDWLERYWHDIDAVNSVFLVSPSGEAVAHLPAQAPPYFANNFHQRVYFRGATLAATQGLGIGVFVSPLFHSRASDGLLKFALSAPVYDETESSVLGIAVATIPAAALAPLLRHPALTLLAPNESSSDARASKVDLVEVAFDAAGRPRLDPASDAERSVYVAKVGDTGYAVMAKLYDPNVSEMRYGLVLWLLGSACVSALGLFFVRWEVAHIERGHV